MLDTIKIIKEYMDGSDWRIRENSNMSFSLQGLNNHIVSHAISDYWLKTIYPSEIANAHTTGDFHIHDLSSLSSYCVGWDLKDIIEHGFNGVSGKVESAPPKHLRTALGQLVNFIFTLQGEAAGAQAVSSFDTLLAPFIRYDGLTYSEVKQAIQEFVFNMNVPTRVGFQTPFSNISLDLVPDEITGEENVIIGGEVKDEKYKDFQEEMNMLNTAFCEVMMEGDSKGRIFTFPIPTYSITSSFDWDSPVANKLFEMTGKYGIPYFSNFIGSDIKPTDVRSMCCRLRISNTELIRRGGGLFGANPLTGSIGIVTINLPRIGYLSKDKEELFSRLFRLMDLAKEALEIKREIVERETENGLYPYSKKYLRLVYERYGKYWQNHFSTIGLIGMNEMLLNFSGNDITTEEGKAFAEEILDKMRDKMTEFQEETGCLFNLEATPAEGTTRRLAAIDKKLYPAIVVANNKDFVDFGAAPYYTNSTQLPVTYTSDIFEALDHQESLQVKYTGGTVIHFYIGESISDYTSVKKLIKTIAENYKIPYYTITPTFSVCPKHGFISGKHVFCPKCDEENGYRGEEDEVRSVQQSERISPTVAKLE